jgi:WD40 repeat protein
MDVSTAPSGAILVTTSSNEIKILDNNGALSETLPIDKRVKIAKFAPKSDTIAIFVFEKTSNEKSVAQVWNLKNKKMVYEIKVHTDAITDVCFTPLERFVAVSSADNSWSLHDYMTAKQHLHLREQA